MLTMYEYAFVLFIVTNSADGIAILHKINASRRNLCPSIANLQFKPKQYWRKCVPVNEKGAEIYYFVFSDNKTVILL